MSSRFCSKCGNKIPRKYKTHYGTLRKTPQNRNLCFSCAPTIKNENHDNKSERHRRKEILVKMLGGKCAKCGYKKSIVALSFHHKNPKDKLFDISHNGSLLHDWEEVVAEAKKCELLCLCCHAILHNDHDS